MDFDVFVDLEPLLPFPDLEAGEAEVGAVGEAVGAAVGAVREVVGAVVDAVGELEGAVVDTVGEVVGAVVDAVGEVVGADGHSLIQISLNEVPGIIYVYAAVPFSKDCR